MMTRLNPLVQNRLVQIVFGIIWFSIIAGVMFTGYKDLSFHGDEVWKLFSSRDFSYIFVEGNLQEVIEVKRPGTEQIWSYYHLLRLINAPLYNYIFGAVWHFNGYTRQEIPLPEQMLEELGLPNQPQNPENINGVDMIYLGRTTSTTLLFLSSIVMFALGWLVSGRVVAYIASMLYGLNPLLLENARRNLHEAPLLLFGLLAILVAAVIAKRCSKRQSVHVGLYALLGVCMGLAVGAKHTGVIFAAGAFGWVIFAELMSRRFPYDWRWLVERGLNLLATGLLSIFVFFLLTPGLWQAPLANLRTTVEVRGSTTERQAQRRFPDATFTDQLRYTTRVSYLQEIDTSRLLRGGAWLLTILAGWGVVAALIKRLNPPHVYSRVMFTGWLVAALPTVLVLVNNALMWSRHYVALVPFVVMLTAVGVQSVFHLSRLPFKKRAHPHAANTVEAGQR